MEHRWYLYVVNGKPIIEAYKKYGEDFVFSGSYAQCLNWSLRHYQ